jgi:hypothetical protein
MKLIILFLTIFQISTSYADLLGLEGQLDTIPIPGKMGELTRAINLVEFTYNLNDEIKTVTVPRDKTRGCYHRYRNHFYDSVMTYSRYLSQTCAKSAKKTKIQVRSLNQEICQLPPRERYINRGNLDHSLSIKDGKVHIGLELDYNLTLAKSYHYFGFGERPKEIEKIVSKCKSMAEDLFSEYDIILDLKIGYHEPLKVDEAKGTTTFANDGNYNIDDRDNGVQSQNTWYLNMNSGVSGCYDDNCRGRGENEQNIKKSCIGFIQSLSLRLGLHDESSQSRDLRRCPDKIRSSDTDPYSIMEFIHKGSNQNDKFHPRHIKKLLGPICPSMLRK